MPVLRKGARRAGGTEAALYESQRLPRPGGSGEEDASREVRRAHRPRGGDRREIHRRQRRHHQPSPADEGIAERQGWKREYIIFQWERTESFLKNPLKGASRCPDGRGVRRG